MLGAFYFSVSLSQLPLCRLPGPVPLCCRFPAMLGIPRAFAQSETRFSSRTDSRLCFSSARGWLSPGGTANAGCPSAARARLRCGSWGDSWASSTLTPGLAVPGSEFVCWLPPYPSVYMPAVKVLFFSPRPSSVVYFRHFFSHLLLRNNENHVK